MSGGWGAGWGNAWGGGAGASIPGNSLIPPNAWQDGWATEWGATQDEATPPAGETAYDAINRALRFVVRTAMGMAPGTVRPANQIAPTGNASDEFATVLILNKTDLGITKGEMGAANDASAPSDQRFAEVLHVHSQVDVSVQFFKTPRVDGDGQPVWSTAAFEKAARLPLRLRFERIAALMDTMNLSLQEAGQARDITAVSAGTYESRGQVELRFFMVSREIDASEIISSAQVGLVYQGPGQQPRTI